MMVNNPLVSVVICAFSSQRFDMTTKCINSILENTYKNYEIILVIDGNHELKQGMDQKYKGFKDLVIFENEKNEGPSISRNRGAEAAKGDIISFIDDDAFAARDWLENIVKDFLEYPEILAVGGKILPFYEDGARKLPEEILWIVGGTYKGHPEKKQLIRNVLTGNMAIKKDIFKDINFEIMIDKRNNNLSHQLEDTLFCLRLNNKKSGTVLYDPEMVVFHHITNSRLKVRSIVKRAFDEGLLKAKLEDINKDKKKTLSVEHNYLIITLLSIIKYFFKFKFRDCMLISLVVSSVLLGYASYLIKGRFPNISFLAKLNYENQ